MRGRKPLPYGLATGHRPHNARDPKPPALEWATVPDLLATDPIAAGEWTRLAPLLRKARQITEADRSALVAVCREWSCYLRESDLAHTEGHVITTKTGALKTNPRLAIARGALARCVKLWAELGCSPSTRPRVHM